MILCLAVGIANIFTFHPLTIVFCAFALYVFFPNPEISKLATNLAE